MTNKEIFSAQSSPRQQPKLHVIKNGNVGPATVAENTRNQVTGSVTTVGRSQVSTRPWDLTKPQYSDENYYRYRAQSILTGMGFKDGSSIGPLLPIEQAMDVVNWNWDTGRML
jgi:hypothetical protein